MRFLYFQDAKEIAPRQWKDGSYQGGIARLAQVLKEQGNESSNTITAFGGELTSGSVFGSLYRGEPFVTLFNQLGVDVAGLGNHDFDFGTQHIRNLIDQAEFPWLSTNLDTSTGEPFSPDGRSVVLHAGSKRIGIISLTGAMETTNVSQEVQEKDALKSAREAVDDLKKEEVDAIIALSQADRSTSLEVAESIPEILAVLREEDGAQTIEKIDKTQDGRWVISAKADYGSVIALDIDFKEDNGSTIMPSRPKVDYNIIPVDEGVSEDKSFLAEQRKYELMMEEELKEVLGTNPYPLTKGEIGMKAAEQFRQYYNADIGFAGGVRVDNLAAGQVTRGDILSIFPFNNKVISLEVTGQEIRDTLEAYLDEDPDTWEENTPWVSGAHLDIAPHKPKGQRIRSIQVGSEEIKPGKLYSFATTDYLRDNEKSGRHMTHAPVLGDDGVTDAEVLSRAFSSYPLSESYKE